MNTTTKIDVHQMVTDRIIEILETGTIPWKQPWTSAGVPMNVISKRAYRGINLWLLLSLNYERNLFLTWDQLKKLGGSVNQGEHGWIVVFWKNVNKVPEELDGNNQPKTVPMLRYYKVFNIAQCKDIPQHLIPAIVEAKHNSLEECEAIVSSMPNSPIIQHKQQKAYYDIAGDLVNMPKKKCFVSSESYYATFFHELVHSTGHEKRLNRKTVTEMAEFGSETYSLEELVAEIGSAFLCASSGILETQIDSSTAYIKGWLGKLKGDKRFIMQASGQAQRAADYIMNTLVTKDEQNESVEESVR